MKRIVKETFKDGTIRYKVECNRMFFGLIPCEWYTDTTTCYGMDGYSTTCNAIFKTLEEAQKHIGINPNPVIKKEIITTTKL